MKVMAAAMSCIVLGLSGCASKPPPSEYDVVLKRPKPAGDQARRDECVWIQTQLARQKELASYVAATATYPQNALDHQAATQRNLAVLESRSQNINCAAALPGASAGRLSFDDCYARCRQYTGRTNEQCFDACNK